MSGIIVVCIIQAVDVNLFGCEIFSIINFILINTSGPTWKSFFKCLFKCTMRKSFD